MSSAAIALLRMKCPKCHKGNLFVNSNPYNLPKIASMPEKCPCCGQLFTPEPAFYYGAMYISYFICIALMFINYLVIEVAFNIKGVWFLTLNAVVLFFLWPVIFRYARVFYIYMFVRYDPEAAKCKSN
jgi:uncharacterized protein (DUF983 family)